ncbi:MAG: MBOAT family protein [Lachnospiraceae bacterium]|nr:MBOAT family protein [Lachnospiraceae bacterium]
MLFSSVGFLFRFLPIFIIVYLALPKYRNIILLLGSLIFYGVGEPYFVLLLLLSVLTNYGLNCYMFWEPRSPQSNRKQKAMRRKKRALAAAVALDLGVLFVFKYWDFAAGSINTLAGQKALPLFSLALPLGISFYTFQMISYQIDCYRGMVQKRADLLTFATYICMFPQLIAGPIVRFGEVSERLAVRRVRIRDLENGFKLFTLGLGLKVLLANQIGTLWNLIMTAGAGRLHVSVAWLGAFAYSFQIYFDFWGYSVMAMGLGKMLGFRIPRNFNEPYTSRSVSEFWRRWHITLGSWFREYVYIPLGGNRRGNGQTTLNLLIVWALTGLWHGAAWNFLLWGIAFFLLISLEKRTYGKWLESSRALGHLYTILLIPVTWMIFAIADMGQLAAYLGNMIGYHREAVLVGTTQLMRYLKEYGILLIACVIFATPLPAKLYYKWKDRWFMVLILLAVFWFSVRGIIRGDNNPFLYFRF